LPKSTSGLGTLSVSGRRRVPKPPTRMSAFMAAAAVLLPTQLPQPVKNAASSRKHSEIEILRPRSDPDAVVVTELRDSPLLSPGPPAYADAMCDVPQHRAHPGGRGMEATRLPLIRRHAERDGLPGGRSGRWLYRVGVGEEEDGKCRSRSADRGSGRRWWGAGSHRSLCVIHLAPSVRDMLLKTQASLRSQCY
jgi:hypothetical protein